MILTPRWFLLFALGAVPLTLAFWLPGCELFLLVWEGLLLLATAADFFLLPPASAFEVNRRFDDHLSLGADNLVELEIRNSHSHRVSAELIDSPPATAAAEMTRFAAELPPLSRTTFQYHIHPHVRGDVEFGDAWLRIAGRFGLTARQTNLHNPEPARVYPNLLETARFTLMARKGRLQQLGIRAARLAGAGRSFESLREYMPDDEYRRIDWKASARKGKLICRNYEVEKSQNIVLVIDVGRTMLAEIDGIAKMDYAVNAALLMAYVAVLADDNVGLLVFDDKVQHWVPPRKGKQQVYRILDALYNVRASRTEPNYRDAFTYLATRWRKRSLMICFTDLWDPDSSRQTIRELIAMQARHLMCCVTLMDTRVLRSADQMPADIQESCELGVAIQILEDRMRAMRELSQRGVLVVDSPADQLSAALVNRYLEVKERMLL